MQTIPFYPSGLLPAAEVPHGYRNVWIRDCYYVGLCVPAVKETLWKALVRVLDLHIDKLKIHAAQRPRHWYEFLHVRYNPEGQEIWHEHWLHHQWDAIACWLEVCLDLGRMDLANMLIDYMFLAEAHCGPSAGAWEDRDCLDAYSLAAVSHACKRYEVTGGPSANKAKIMADTSQRYLNNLLPFATPDRKVCLSLLGVIWPFQMHGDKKDLILSLVKEKLMREPYGFIRYQSDTYDGEGFGRGYGTELPWLLGDLFMAKIEPENQRWKDRILSAQKHFGCMPEAFFPETLVPNRNTPLIWAEAMAHDLQS